MLPSGAALPALGQGTWHIGDAARSPVVRELGSRDQPSAGIALSYTFGGDR